jgi:hypothetical protein
VRGWDLEFESGLLQQRVHCEPDVKKISGLPPCLDGFLKALDGSIAEREEPDPARCGIRTAGSRLARAAGLLLLRRPAAGVTDGRPRVSESSSLHQRVYQLSVPLAQTHSDICLSVLSIS